MARLHDSYLDAATELEITADDDVDEIDRLLGELRGLLDEIAKVSPSNATDCQLILDAAIEHSAAVLVEHKPEALRALRKVCDYLLAQSSGLSKIHM